MFVSISQRHNGNKISAGNTKEKLNLRTAAAQQQCVDPCHYPWNYSAGR